MPAPEGEYLEPEAKRHQRRRREKVRRECLFLSGYSYESYTVLVFSARLRLAKAEGEQPKCLLKTREK